MNLGMVRPIGVRGIVEEGSPGMSINPFHHDYRLSILMKAELVYGGNVGVIKVGHQPGFVDERSCHVLSVSIRAGPLQGDLPAERFLGGGINLSHSTGSYGFVDGYFKS